METVARARFSPLPAPASAPTAVSTPAGAVLRTPTAAATGCAVGERHSDAVGARGRVVASVPVEAASVTLTVVGSVRAAETARFDAVGARTKAGVCRVGSDAAGTVTAVLRGAGNVSSRVIDAAKSAESDLFGMLSSLFLKEFEQEVESSTGGEDIL